MIDSLRLKNFKCFEDQRLYFKRLTLLTGVNGMGKSTILQAMLLLRQSHLRDWLRKNGLALNGELVQLGTARDILYEGAMENQIEIDIELKNGLQAKWTFDYNHEADVLNQLSAEIPEEIFESGLFTDNFHYLQAERIGPRTWFPMSDYLARQRRQLGSRGEYAAHFLQLFGEEKIPHNSMEHFKAKSNSLLAQVEAWTNEISPGTRIHVTSYSGMDLVNLQYSFALGKQVSNFYRATSVGFGITYTLPILIALLSSQQGALVLLENPEAHLHPQGQVRIGEILALAANYGIQVVVETHSDHILNGIRIAVQGGRLSAEHISLNFFERRDYPAGSRTTVATPNMDQNGRIDYWPEGFFDEWDKSLEKLLKPLGN
ncbi:MAG: DUF3696 domain-containing protein [bacterium]